MKDGSPLVYDEVKNNISVREATVHGDVESALNSAAAIATLRASRMQRTLQSLESGIDLGVPVGSRHEGSLEGRRGQVDTALQRSVEESPEHCHVR